MCEILDKLSKYTYRIEHNPNCPSQYLVRLVGWSRGQIDGKPTGHPLMAQNTETTADAYGYGKTLEAAAEAAIAMKEAGRVKPNSISAPAAV
jgi:hypothetical protein